MTGGTVTGSDVVGRSGSEQNAPGSATGAASLDGPVLGTGHLGTPPLAASSAGGSAAGRSSAGASSAGAAFITASSPEASSPETSAAGAAEERPRPKIALRRRLLALRRAGVLPDPAVLTERVLALPEVARATCVAAYVGMTDEPDTTELLARLRARGVRVLLPVVRADLDLDFREFGGTLVPGAMGTREPPPSATHVELGEAEVIIVPALAADEAGNRLGRGGGSYDRALTRTAPATPVIALLHDREVLGDVPAEAHDRRVTIIVTQSRTVRPASL
ncbi:5-formyltetrahydrofolate cyclo-ligase [Parafrankia elaeagni]|uniref:5-formyltetrahydrofolate cyclo-ligase n=1 Tax=Parafrankia elaeagni TaxID=222534 RepID=UPI001E3B3F7D|nr:5-formyltetrahydrofolate cyclo-ligase [Parafrankia elaeagni]